MFNLVLRLRARKSPNTVCMEQKPERKKLRKIMGFVQALLSQIGKQNCFKHRTYCYSMLYVHEEMKSHNRKFTSSLGYHQAGEEE